jgi:hypothetical protein
MSNFDDLFKQEETQSTTEEQPFDKEAWKQQKQEQREKVYSMIDEAAGSVAKDGSVFQRYLDVQSRFDRYSVSNALLILAQKPEATRIMDFDAWKEQGAFVRKRESGLYILEPGEEYQRDDGTTGINYNPKRVFDISQTSNRSRREPQRLPDERTRIKALMDHAPVPIHINDNLPEGMNAAYLSETREIQIRRGLGADDIFRALSQELAHADMDTGSESYNRADHAFPAYCASYMLCKRYGVDTGTFRFDRAPEMLKDRDPQAIRLELSGMKEAYDEISGRINHMLAQERQENRQEPER